MSHRGDGASIYRRLVPIGAGLLVAVLAWTVCPAADGSLDQPARVFIDESLRGIGADRIACPADVVEQVRSHRTAFCEGIFVSGWRNLLLLMLEISCT